MQKPNSASSYKFRLLTTLLAEDIIELLLSLGTSVERYADENRYRLMRAWNSDIEQKVFQMIKKRIHEDD